MHQGGPVGGESLPATEPQAALGDEEPAAREVAAAPGGVLPQHWGPLQGANPPLLLKAGGFYSRYLTFLRY